VLRDRRCARCNISSERSTLTMAEARGSLAPPPTRAGCRHKDVEPAGGQPELQKGRLTPLRIRTRRLSLPINQQLKSAIGAAAIHSTTAHVIVRRLLYCCLWNPGANRLILPGSIMSPRARIQPASGFAGSPSASGMILRLRWRRCQCQKAEIRSTNQTVRRPLSNPQQRFSARVLYQRTPVVEMQILKYGTSFFLDR